VYSQCDVMSYDSVPYGRSFWGFGEKSSSTSTLKKEGSRFFRKASSHLPDNVVSQRRKPIWESLTPCSWASWTKLERF